MSASIMYNRPLRNRAWGNWATTALWGRTRGLGDNAKYNSYLLESTARFRVRNYLWTRLENAERSSELLLDENSTSANLPEEPIGRVQAYTLGYAHDIDLVPHVASAFGAQVTAYVAPDRLQPIYGSHPVGVAVFLRLRPFSEDQR
jgi:hypothetical protein